MKTRRFCRSLLMMLMLMALGAIVVAPQARAATFVVDQRFEDSDDGVCGADDDSETFDDCTLREAINAANDNPGADVINFEGLFFSPRKRFCSKKANCPLLRAMFRFKGRTRVCLRSTAMKTIGNLERLHAFLIRFRVNSPPLAA